MPHSVRKASGFPDRPKKYPARGLASRFSWGALIGKPEAYRTGSGKAAKKKSYGKRQSGKEEVAREAESRKEEVAREAAEPQEEAARTIHVCKTSTPSGTSCRRLRDIETYLGDGWTGIWEDDCSRRTLSAHPPRTKTQYRSDRGHHLYESRR